MLAVPKGFPNEVAINAEVAANARLIAAAPELLAALKAAANCLGNASANMPDCPHRNAWATARAAIAKAEGEANG